VNGAPQATTVSKSSETSDTEPQKLLSPQQIRDLTGLHEEVIRRAIRDGELRASKLRGKLRVRPQDYDAWIDQNAVAPGDWA
jgi:excisionase family DNA binding protein